MSCEDCKVPDAEYVEDPFIAEIRGETVMRWLCDDCRYERAMDI
ncbi:hypothetical protein BKA00_007449 [Actinomadura coerulea]|uniref:Uncharacterized protein n=1 Tax=Actinomadura coerulea TaxID=46159 RepID=A0A7X0G6R9_9ACTN|nr:hypothetical protein [Actinomadura coerulea]MBB6400535.1 hypothetical protein [Actinomadura coerulea]GGQ07928.1 hypothetical protein GCM10010187_25030 [Actinomadura coerulea]